MAKAIILTYAPVTKEEKELLKNANVFKIATNFSAAELRPNIRLTADNIVDKCLNCDSCPVISLNYDLEKPRVINGCTMPSRHSSLLSCIDYLYFAGYSDVLLVASNPEKTATFQINYDGVKQYKDFINLYKYTSDGCLDIPHKTVKEFLMLTDEEKLLGRKEPEAKKLFEKTIFTDSFKYEIWTEGLNNKSIENGEIIKNILPVDVKDRLLNGETEIKYNGLCIKVLTEFKKVEVSKEEPKEEVKEEVKPVVKKKPVAKKKVKK